MEDEPKKWKRRNPFFDLFSEFDRMDEMMDEMMGRAFKGLPSGKPMTYGFSMKIGPDGKPKIQEFGNVRPTEEKLEVRDHREPLIDVMDRENEIDVIAELPGVEKKDIDLRFDNGDLVISVPKKFHKRVHLKEKVDEDNIRATYKNGVLTVVLKKLMPAKKKGKKVRVE
ncbi:MAG: Hsp20/alpha crystallin family protein [Candidatus Diapherotrites archaeon]|nr:Hsp20/alpha crystallin family protein [Candidatus Diapherotrites archaeon]